MAAVVNNSVRNNSAKSKKKRVAPLKKASETLKINNETDEFFEAGEEIVDDVLGELFGNEDEGKTFSDGKESDWVDLDDWSRPPLKPSNSAVNKSDSVKSSTPPSKPLNVLTGLISQKNDCRQITQNDPKPMSAFEARKSMFTSKNTEEDPIIGFRFTTREISAAAIKDLTVSMEFVSILEALKCAESKKIFTAGVVTDFKQLKGAGSMVTVTDLAAEPCSVRVLLFASAFSTHKYVPVGNIVIILNPKKGKPYNGKEALVVNNDQYFIMAGISRDYGLCSGRTKAGKACKNVVNFKLCRFCSYHAMSAFKNQKMGKNMKSVALGNGLLSVQSAPSADSWMSPLARNIKLVPGSVSFGKAKKDKDILARLSSETQNVSCSPVPEKGVISLKRKFENSPYVNNPAKRPAEDKINTSTQAASLGGFFDHCSSSTSKQRISSAKRKALEFARQSGGIASTLPKKPIIIPSLEDENPTDNKKNLITPEFLALMKEKPSNPALLAEAEAEEQDQRFDRLKIIEEVGEKLIKTHEVAVRALRCLVCQKNYFQLPLQCFKSNHKCKVVTGTKRFFKCNSCNNRTTTLERLPTTECSKCGKWVWGKAGMAADRVCSVAKKLSVRGLEEKFLGSVVHEANLSLLMPDDK